MIKKFTADQTRAYAILNITKAVDDGADGERIIEGIATTPTPDRYNDVVEPMGAKFALPMPLLWQHRSDQPVGHVTFAKPNKNGIPFKARIAKSDTPGKVKERLDEAWESLKLGLVRAVSIGFNPLEWTRLDTGGYRFLEWEWMELSLVTIPAQADATISSIKSADRQIRAALGNGGSKRAAASAGVAVKSTKQKELEMKKKTFAEQIREFEVTKEAKSAEMLELMEAAGEAGETLDADQQELFDTLEGEIKSIDQHITRLKSMEAISVKTARAVDEPNGNMPGVIKANGERSDRGDRVAAQPKLLLPKGTAFTRYAMALAAGRGNISDALMHAKRWDNETPEVAQYIKAVAGTSEPASPGWGSELVFTNNLAAEFIELLRPATIMGRINGWRRVPFNVSIPVQTGGSTVNWVGEKAPKPVSELDFTRVTLGYNKVAGIVVLSEELVRLSSPSAEEVVRRDLVEQITQFLDSQLIDSTITATSVRPASLTNGVAGVAASGTDADALYYDLNAALAMFDALNLSTSSLHLVMTPALARGISTLRNALGQFEFTGLTAAGGTLMGFPVIVSNGCPAGNIIMINASEVLVADDGAVRLDASNQATLDMSGGADANVSLWQNNLIGIRAERWIDYKKRRANVVNRITGAAYGPSSGS